MNPSDPTRCFVGCVQCSTLLYTHHLRVEPTQHEHPRGKDNPGMLAIHQLIESKVAEQKEKLTMLQIATDDVYFMSDDVSEKVGLHQHCAFL